jgi:hypothetical protein
MRAMNSQKESTLGIFWKRVRQEAERREKGALAAVTVNST